MVVAGGLQWREVVCWWQRWRWPHTCICGYGQELLQTGGDAVAGREDAVLTTRVDASAAAQQLFLCLVTLQGPGTGQFWWPGWVMVAPWVRVVPGVHLIVFACCSLTPVSAFRYRRLHLLNGAATKAVKTPLKHAAASGLAPTAVAASYPRSTTLTRCAFHAQDEDSHIQTCVTSTAALQQLCCWPPNVACASHSMLTAVAASFLLCCAGVHGRKQWPHHLQPWRACLGQELWNTCVQNGGWQRWELEHHKGVFRSFSARW